MPYSWDDYGRLGTKFLNIVRFSLEAISSTCWPMRR